MQVSRTMVARLVGRRMGVNVNGAVIECVVHGRYQNHATLCSVYTELICETCWDFPWSSVDEAVSNGTYTLMA